MTKSNAGSFALALWIGFATSSWGVAADATYRVVSELPDSGAMARSMTIDAASRRLYVARDDGVDVYDIDAARRVGSAAIRGVPGGLRVAADAQRGYVSVPASNSVAIFDLSSLAVLSVSRTGGVEPREIEYDAGTRRIYVSHTGSGGLVALDAMSGKRVGAIALKGRLRQSVSDGRGALFVASESDSVLHVIDTATLTSQGTVSVWPCEAPTALANDAKERRIYVACGNSRMVIVDPDPGQMIGTVSVAGRGESGMAMQVAPARLVRLFMPTAEGTLNVVQNAKLTATLERSVELGSQSPAVAVDDQTGRVFIWTRSGVAVVSK